MTVVHDSWWHEQFSKSCDYAVMTSPTLEVDYTIKFSANTVPAAQSRNLQLIHLSQEGHKRANSLNLEEIAFGLLFYVAYPWLEIRWFFKVIWSHSDDMTSNCGRVFNGLLSRSWSCICKFVEWWCRLVRVKYLCNNYATSNWEEWIMDCLQVVHLLSKSDDPSLSTTAYMKICQIHLTTQ